MKYLILGSGPAGIAAAKAIRGKDKKGQIVVVTEEPGPPYLRPLLTDLIMGRVDVAGIADPQAKDLAERGIDVRNGKRALKVDSAGNRVIFVDGAEEPYDVLLVATGGKPEIPLPLRKEHPAILPFDSPGRRASFVEFEPSPTARGRLFFPLQEVVMRLAHPVRRAFSRLDHPQRKRSQALLAIAGRSRRRRTPPASPPPNSAGNRPFPQVPGL